MKYFDIKNVDPDGPGYSAVSINFTLEQEHINFHTHYGAPNDITLDPGSKILVVMSDQLEDIIIVKDKAVVKNYDSFICIECGDELVLVDHEADSFRESDFDDESFGDYFEEDLKDVARKEGFDLIILHQ